MCKGCDVRNMTCKIDVVQRGVGGGGGLREREQRERQEETELRNVFFKTLTGNSASEFFFIFFLVYVFNFNTMSCYEIQNTKEIKRTLFNKTKQDKTCTFSM